MNDEVNFRTAQGNKLANPTLEQNNSQCLEKKEQTEIQTQLLAIRQNLKTLSRLLMVFIGQQTLDKFDLVESGDTLEIRTAEDEDELNIHDYIKPVEPFPLQWLT